MSFSIQKQKEDGEPEIEESEGEPDYVRHAQEKLDMTEDELREAMDDMKKRYEGLVSLDSAAAILVCHDHDINLVEEVKGEQTFDFEIQNLIEGMRSVDMRCTVDQIQSLNTFDGGQVRSIVVSDSSGRTQIAFWDEDAESLDAVRSGDQIVVKNGYTKDSMSDYQQDRFGVPGVQVGDSTTVEVESDGEWVEIVS